MAGSPRAHDLHESCIGRQLLELGQPTVEQEIGGLCHGDRDQVPVGVVEPRRAIAAVPAATAGTGDTWSGAVTTAMTNPQPCPESTGPAPAICSGVRWLVVINSTGRSDKSRWSECTPLLSSRRENATSAVASRKV